MLLLFLQKKSSILLIQLFEHCSTNLWREDLLLMQQHNQDYTMLNQSVKRRFIAYATT